MVDLPDFIRRLQHRTPEPTEPVVGQSIGELYQELREGKKTDGWITSPRGCWVDFQLQWFERRQRENALSDRGLPPHSGPRNDKDRGNGGRAA